MHIGELWDQRYATDLFHFGEAPNVFLAEHVGWLPPGGRVLSLGEGEGRNAVFLAERGFVVTAWDASPRGLAKLERLAAGRGVRVAAEVVDLAEAVIAPGAWDAIINIFCHLPAAIRAGLYPQVAAGLAPGGVFLTEQFAVTQVARDTGGPRDPDLLLELDAFDAAFAGCEVLLREVVTTWLDEGPKHQGTADVMRFAARRRGVADLSLPFSGLKLS